MITSSPLLTALSTSLAVLGTALTVASARAGGDPGPEFDGVDVKNRLGTLIDTSLTFHDGSGKAVTLADYLDGSSPIIFTLNYYRCTSVCSVQLNALVDTLKTIAWLPGEKPFRMVTVSFDAADTAEVAAGKQHTYQKELVRQLATAEGTALTEAELEQRAANVDWTFLVADQPTIDKLLHNVGYSVRYDTRSKQYAHSPVTYILSPDGRINRYLWGFTVPPQDLKFGLMESSNGSLGSFGEKLLFSCFNYSAEHGSYAPFALGIMRLAGGLVTLIFGTYLFLQWRRERRLKLAVPVLPASPSESRS